jgi:hypothetical protein
MQIDPPQIPGCASSARQPLLLVSDVNQKLIFSQRRLPPQIIKPWLKTGTRAVKRCHRIDIRAGWAAICRFQKGAVAEPVAPGPGSHLGLDYAS